MSSRLAIHAAALLGLADVALSASVPKSSPRLSLEIPTVASQRLSDEVDPDFLGLAFEESSWTRYARNDDGKANEFSKNLMHGIYSRTGGKPIIRLGGTSPDYGRYIPDLEEPVLPVAEQDNYQNIGFTTIGPDYWSIAKDFPDAKFMVQVPLATTNASESVEWAKAAVEIIGLDQIHSIQIGNEPDLYSDDFRGEGDVYLGPPDYQGTLDNETYVGNYTERATAIRKAVDLPDHFFTAFDVAANVDEPWVAQWLLDTETCFDLGIDDDKIIKEVSHHYYQNQAGGAEDLEAGLMDMSLTHTNLDYLKKRIHWLKANHPEMPFIINEIGNSLERTNSYEYQARLGSALWAVDFYLYSLSIGVSRFNYQQIMHSGYDLWLPVASAGYEAQVFSNYYSHPFLADFVGKSGKTRVAKMDLENGDSYPNLAAYLAYEGVEAKRLAIANLDYWNKTSSDHDRPVHLLDLKTPKETKSVVVTYLNSPGGAGADAESITYAGSQWTHASHGKEVKDVRHDTERVQVKDGVATIRIPSSSAAIVYLDAPADGAN